MTQAAPEARRIALPFLLGTAVALCGGGIVVALVAIDPVVTSRARDALVERGVVCDERFSVDVAWGLDHATVAPTRCQLVEVDYAESVELPEGAEVTLSGLSATELHATTVRVYLGEAASLGSVSLGPLGVLGAMTGVDTRVAATARAASELASHEPPATTVDRVELVRGDAVEVTLETLHLTPGEPLTVTVERAALGELSGPMGTSATGELRDVSGTATASTCHLEGDLAVSARVPILGTIAHETHLVVDGSALDGPSPTLSVSMR